MKVPSELVENIHKFCNIDTRFTLEKVIGQNIRHRLNMEESEILGLFKSEKVTIGSEYTTRILKIGNNFAYEISLNGDADYRYYIAEWILHCNAILNMYVV